MKKRGGATRRLGLKKETLAQLRGGTVVLVGGGDTVGPSVCACGLSIHIPCQETEYTTWCWDRNTKPIYP